MTETPATRHEDLSGARVSNEQRVIVKEVALVLALLAGAVMFGVC